MAEIARLYVDTNVLVSLGEGSDEISRAILDLVGTIMPDEEFLFTSELTLAELLVVPQREKNEDLIRLYDNWIQPEGWLIAKPVDKPVLWGASLIRATYPSIKLPDAIHVSTAMRHGCNHILSADKRLPREMEVTIMQDGHLIGIAKVEVVLLTVDSLAEIVVSRSS